MKTAPIQTVMILGAGVPRAAAGQNPLLQNSPPLDMDFFEVARVGEYPPYNKVIQCIKKLVGEYSVTLTQSLEMVATYLHLKAVDSKLGSEYHTGFLQFLKLLNFVLAKTTNDLSVAHDSLVYRFILNELNKLDNPSKLTIITFNYDLLIENVLDEIAKNSRPDVFAFPECYRMKNYASMSGAHGYPKFQAIGKQFQGVGVLKLHGSMNWQSVHTSPTLSSRALFNPSRRLYIINSKKIPRNLVRKRKKRKMYCQPTIVPPISGKRGIMHASMPKLWSRAGRRLRKADRIVIAGYSCPPLDLEARILLSENLRQNQSKKVYVIDPNPQSAAKFLDLCGVTHTTIYSSIKSWIDDSVIS